MTTEVSQRYNLLITRLFGLWMVVAASLVLPFSNPGFLDYPNHLARFYVMTRDFHSEFYNAHYEDNFRLLPNIGIDAIMMLVGRVMPATIGLRLVLSTSIVLFCVGFFRIHRSVSIDRFSPLILLIPVFAYSYSLLLGFLNFFLGSALLPWAYLSLRAKASDGRWIVVQILWVIGLFYCHFFALLVYCFIAGLTLALDYDHGFRKTQKVGFLFIFLGSVVLYKLSPTSGEQSTIVFSTLSAKFKYFFAPFVFGPNWIPASVGIFTLLGLSFGSKSIRLTRFGQVAIIALFCLYLACPFGLQISGNFDGRLPSLLIAFACVFSVLSKEQSLKTVLIIVNLVACLHFGNCGLTMLRTDQEGRKARFALANVPAGASLVSFGINNADATHRDSWYPNLNMIQFMAVPERPMHVHGIFSFQSQQPVLIKPALQTALSIPGGVRNTPESVRQKAFLTWRTTVASKLLPMHIAEIYILIVDFKQSGGTVATKDAVLYRDQTYTLIRCDLSKG